MPNPVYDFQTQLSLGKKAEDKLDKLFSKWYLIDTVPMEDERRGIDRIFRPLDTMVPVTVEYKTDFKAAETKRAFIETVSVEVDGEVRKKGWAYTCEADYLVYWAYGWEVLVVKPHMLRHYLKEWTEKYRPASGRNGEYKSRGVLVPWPILRLISVLESRLYLGTE